MPNEGNPSNSDGAGPSNGPCVQPPPPIRLAIARPGTYYRETTLGRTLQESLKELMDQGKIPYDLAQKILIHFDVRMKSKLHRCTPRVSFNAEKIVFRKEEMNVFNVWLRNVELSIKSFAMFDRAVFPCITDVRLEAHPSMIFSRKKMIKKKDRETAKKEKVRKDKEKKERETLRTKKHVEKVKAKNLVPTPSWGEDEEESSEFDDDDEDDCDENQNTTTSSSSDDDDD